MSLMCLTLFFLLFLWVSLSLYLSLILEYKTQKQCLAQKLKLMIIWIFSPSWIIQNIAWWTRLCVCVCETEVELECVLRVNLFLSMNKEPSVLYVHNELSILLHVCLVCISLLVCVRVKTWKRCLSILQGSRLPVNICLSLWSLGPPAIQARCVYVRVCPLRLYHCQESKQVGVESEWRRSCRAWTGAAAAT